MAPRRPLSAARRARERRLTWILWTIWSQSSGRLGLFLLTAVCLTAFFGPLVIWWDPNEMGVGPELAGPSPAHPFGTDEFGRDLLARIAAGLRTSIAVSLVSVTAGAAAGVTLGLVAGYLGGRLDAVVTRAGDILLPYPPILVGVALTAALGASAVSVAIAIAVVSIPLFLRVARAAVLVERSREYVEAARALGADALRILTRHLLPNSVTPLLTQFTITTAYAVVLESGLSFLGVGVLPPQASLGSTLSTARGYMQQAPSYAVFPGLFIAALLLSLNLLSDATRDALDPKRLSERG